MSEPLDDELRATHTRGNRMAEECKRLRTERDALRAELAACRAAVIEECARVADAECERTVGINADRYWQSRRIRDAIRAALAKGGGDA